MEQRLGNIGRQVSLALSAIAALPDGPIQPIPNVMLHMNVGEPPESSPASREQCRAWLIGAGLRDGIDGLGILCEETWRCCCLEEAARRGPIRLTQAATYDVRSLADSILGKEARSIDALGLSGKLDLLHERFGVPVRWRDEVDSIVIARNCLTHRLGIVAERDVNDTRANLFRLKCRFHGMYLRAEGHEDIKLSPGIVAERESSVVIRFGELHERTFGIGEHLSLSNQEFMHIITTLVHVGQDIVGGTIRFMSSRTATDLADRTSN